MPTCNTAWRLATGLLAMIVAGIPVPGHAANPFDCAGSDCAVLTVGQPELVLHPSTAITDKLHIPDSDFFAIELRRPANRQLRWLGLMSNGRSSSVIFADTLANVGAGAFEGCSSDALENPQTTGTCTGGGNAAARIRVLSPGKWGTFGDCGKWLKAVDEYRPGKLVGFYHAETAIDRGGRERGKTRADMCVPGAPRFAGETYTAGVAYSDDGGLTWRDGGQIIDGKSAAAPTLPVAIGERYGGPRNGGGGDFTLTRYDGHYYLTGFAVDNRKVWGCIRSFEAYANAQSNRFDAYKTAGRLDWATLLTGTGSGEDSHADFWRFFEAYIQDKDRPAASRCLIRNAGEGRKRLRLPWRTMIARAEVSDLGKPGSWRSYFRGVYSEPSMGGRYDPLFAGVTRPRMIVHAPSGRFLALTLLKSFNNTQAMCSLHPDRHDRKHCGGNGFGWMVGFGPLNPVVAYDAARDRDANIVSRLPLIPTSDAAKGQASREFDHGGRPGLHYLYEYPTIIGSEGGAQFTDSFYIYYKLFTPMKRPNQRYHDNWAAYLVRRPVTVSPAPRGHQVRMDLYSYHVDGDTWVSTELPVLDRFKDAGGRALRHVRSLEQKLLGRLYTSKNARRQGDPPMRRLWDCYDAANDDHFVSRDHTCEGKDRGERKFRRVLGFVYSAEPDGPGTDRRFVALYRCKSGKDSYVSHEDRHSCRDLLGYIESAGS